MRISPCSVSALWLILAIGGVMVCLSIVGKVLTWGRGRIQPEIHRKTRLNETIGDSRATNRVLRVIRRFLSGFAVAAVTLVLRAEGPLMVTKWLESNELDLLFPDVILNGRISYDLKFSHATFHILLILTFNCQV